MRRRDLLLSSMLPMAAANPGRDAAIAAAVAKAAPAMVEQRRDFHMHPELMYDVKRTAGVVAQRLQQLGLSDIRTGVGRTGVTALLRGGKPGPVIALRADMDALPIDESASTLPWKSKTPGVKHACGHDAHTAMLLGTAEVLQSMKAEFPGTVKFIFQPAEEGGRGADAMIRDGALENPRPQAILGQHVWPASPTGQIDYCSGAFMASGDFFTLTITGKSAHGARPEDGIDAVLIASECITALQAIRSRRIATSEQMVLTVGSIKGGTAPNIVADKVELTGTLRTLSGTVRDRVVTLMHQTLGGITQAHGGAYKLEVRDMATVTYNEPALVSSLLPSMRRVAGEKSLVAIGPQMVAEDFSFYQKVIPGFFWFLGVRNEAKGCVHPVHTPEFDLDEDAMPLGVKLMTSLAFDFSTAK
jgi:amidohydrolase